MVSVRETRRWWTLAPAVSVLLLAAALLCAASPAFASGAKDENAGSPEATEPAEPEELRPVEVRSYEGEYLSSIYTSFRENSIEGPQHVDIEHYRLNVDGLVTAPLALSYEEVLTNDSYRKVVTINCVAGWNATILWEGVLVRDLIGAAEPEEVADTVIFHAHDGYTTSFPLDFVTENDILMAYKMNDVELPPERGFPFQLVAEQKWGYKWIKWIARIELSNDKDFRGYWESRGYSQIGDLDGPMTGD